MNALPIWSSKSGIIGVSVGPGRVQLMRMPLSASARDRHTVQTMMTSLDGA